jgi:uncharacterized membrane protein
MNRAPSPQPSPTRGEGVNSEGAVNVENALLTDSEVAKETTNIPTNETPPLPSRERVEREGVNSEGAVNVENSLLTDSAMAKEITNIAKNETPPLPPRERVGGEGGLRTLRIGASVSLIALIFLCLAWEAVLAPLKPGGSLLMLKAVPLLLPLFGILKGRRYTYQWACMFILLYFTEGVVRAWSDVGLSSKLALIEVVLSLIFFFCTIYYAKLTRQPPQ